MTRATSRMSITDTIDTCGHGADSCVTRPLPSAQPVALVPIVIQYLRVEELPKGGSASFDGGGNRTSCQAGQDVFAGLHLRRVLYQLPRAVKHQSVPAL